MSDWASANAKDEERMLSALPPSLREVVEEFLALHDARGTAAWDVVVSDRKDRLKLWWDNDEAFAEFTWRAASWSEYHDTPSSWMASFGTYASDESRVLSVVGRPLRRWDDFAEFIETAFGRRT